LTKENTTEAELGLNTCNSMMIFTSFW